MLPDILQVSVPFRGRVLQIPFSCLLLFSLPNRVSVPFRGRVLQILHPSCLVPQGSKIWFAAESAALICFRLPALLSMPCSPALPWRAANCIRLFENSCELQFNNSPPVLFFPAQDFLFFQIMIVSSRWASPRPQVLTAIGSRRT